MLSIARQSIRRKPGQTLFRTLGAGYATPAAGTGGVQFQVFDRNVKYLQRERAATDAENSRLTDYLRDEVARRLVQRLYDIQRNFDKVLDLGANSCNIARALTLPPENLLPDHEDPPLTTKIGHMLATDSCATLLHRDEDQPWNSEIDITREVLLHDETLPYDPSSFDLVISSLSLHWVNDLPSLLTQANKILKPDSPFLAVMLGGDTLYELRTSLQLAELERTGGVSPRVSPLADVRDVGSLLQRSGFKMPTVDVDDLVIDYPSVFALMQDLQAMGESNCVLGRELGPIGRDVLVAADAIYRELHGTAEGTLPATFRLIYMIGWTDGPNQNQPLARGSGEINMKDVLEGKR